DGQRPLAAVPGLARAREHALMPLNSRAPALLLSCAPALHTQRGCADVLLPPLPLVRTAAVLARCLGGWFQCLAHCPSVRVALGTVFHQLHSPRPPPSRPLGRPSQSADRRSGAAPSPC